jgi:hypothetical protein
MRARTKSIHVEYVLVPLTVYLNCALVTVGSDHAAEKKTLVPGSAGDA